MKRLWVLLLASFSLLILVIVGCATRGEDSLPVVCVTIQPQKLFVESIAGNMFDVHCMLTPEGCADESTPSCLPSEKLKNVVAYLTVGGLACEQACLDSVLQVNPKMDVYDTTMGIDTIMGAYAWCSPKQALVIAKNTYRAILELDPRNKEYYKKRFGVLEQELKAVDGYLSKQLAPISHHTAFIIDSPSFSYLAHDYGLTQICVEHAESEPLPHLLDELKDVDKVVPVRAIFVQDEHELPQADTLATELGCRVISINTLNCDWFSEIENIANAFTQGDTLPQGKL